MDITLTIFGYEVAKIKINLPPAAAVEQVPAIDRGIEVISDWWVQRMLKKHSR